MTIINVSGGPALVVGGTMVAAQPPNTLDVTGYDYSSDNYSLGPQGTSFDTDTCTVSLWFKYDSSKSAEGVNMFFHFAGGRFFVTITSTGIVYCECWNTVPAKIQRFDSNAVASYLTDDAWHHVLLSRDGLNAWIYIDDVDALNTHSVNVGGNTSLGSGIGWYIGMVFNNTFGMKGCMSNMWIDTTVGYDLSVEDNRRKFITAGLEPVDPGADGSGPTGASPIVWVPNGLPTTNAGTQANFSLTSGDGAVAC